MFPAKITPRLLQWGVVGICLFIALVRALFQAPPEPEWQGRSLRGWVSAHASGEAVMVAKAEEAFAAMASDAVPFLIHHLPRNESRESVALKQLLNRIPGMSISYRCSDCDNEGGIVESFQAMGPLAASAVPALRKLLFEEETAYSAALALSAVAGTASVPILAGALTNQNETVCWAAIEAVSLLGTNAEPVLPLLLTLTCSPNMHLQNSAHYALGFVGQNRPELVVPTLCNAVKRSRAGTYFYAELYALEHLGTAAAAAAPEVINLLKDPGLGPLKRARAITVLIRILGKGALPHLLELTNMQDPRSVAAAINGLGELGTNAATAVPLLVQFATNETQYVRSAAIDALGRIESHAELAVPVLIENLDHESEFIRIRSALILAVFGTNAQPAVPVLRRLVEAKTHSPFHGGDEWLCQRLGIKGTIWDSFTFALDRIDPNPAELANR